MNDNKTKCCGVPALMDPIVAVPALVTFAKVARCVGCYRFLTPARVLYGAPKNLAAAWTGTSEALLIDFYSGPRLRSPLHFKMAGKVLVPEGMEAQAELPEEEVPF